MLRLTYEDFVELARRNLPALLQLVRQKDLTPFERSFALEALAYADDADRCLPVLFEFLEHADAQLRVGAVHGLGGYLDVPTIRHWLEKLAACDPSEDVREALEAVL